VHGGEPPRENEEHLLRGVVDVGVGDAEPSERAPEASSSS
jgi:hypothetical protein